MLSACRVVACALLGRGPPVCLYRGCLPFVPLRNRAPELCARVALEGSAFVLHRGEEPSGALRLASPAQVWARRPMGAAGLHLH
jgi:hypothetical protein